MKRSLFAVALLALAMTACSTSPLSDGTYWVKKGKVGTLGDGFYKVTAGTPASYNPQTGQTTPLPEPTTSLWGIIAVGVAAMVAGRLVGLASAKIPFLAPVAPFLTAILGGTGFRPAVVTEKPPAGSQGPPA